MFKLRIDRHWRGRYSFALVPYVPTEPGTACRHEDSSGRHIRWKQRCAARLCPWALFIISVRNLPSATKHCKARQYADDVSLYKAGKDLNQLTLDLAEDTDIVRDFLAARGLCLGQDSAHNLQFRSKSTPLTPDVSLQLNNTFA